MDTIISNMGKYKQPLYWYEVSVLIFIEIILAFSSLGYIVVAPISLTFMTIPVLVGALLLGPREGALLGAVFGMTSMWKASTTAVSYADCLFSPWMSGYVWGSIMLSIGSRIVFGYVAGCLFLMVKRYFNHSKIMIVLAALLSIWVHSLLVYFFMWDMFPPASAIAIAGVENMMNPVKLVDWLITCGIVLTVDIVNKLPAVKKVRSQVNAAERIKLKRKDLSFFCVLAVVTINIAVSVFWHFYDRLDKILEYNMIVINPLIEDKIFQIGLQFLASVVSLAGCMALLLIIMIEYSKHMEHESECDSMTQLYNRGTLVAKAKERLNKKDVGNVAFIMLDIDDFKSINDTYGHPYGDAVLQEIAKVLPTCFRNKDLIGRMGGDEFGVFMTGDYTAERVQQAVKDVCMAVNQIQISANGRLGKKLSCSIGAVMSTGSLDFRNIYQKADDALYQTKQKGKNGYTFMERI